MDFEGGKSTLRLVLHDLGFRFKKRDGRRYLIELPRITLLRMRFLHEFVQLKRDLYYIISTDETWFMQFGSGKIKEWQDDSVQSCSAKHIAPSGKRYILLHAGGAQGFVAGAEVCYCSTAKPKNDDDFHGEVNANLMRKYWSERLIPNLPDIPCAILQDNASYHMAQVTKLYSLQTKVCACLTS